MKVIIAGSRSISDYFHIVKAVNESAFTITEVVSGGASGVDRLGEQWARAHNIPIRFFPALWTTHGRQAGPMRNTEMAHHADALIAVWDGKSKGTEDMILKARKLKRLVYVHKVQEGYIPPPSTDKPADRL